MSQMPNPNPSAPGPHPRSSSNAVLWIILIVVLVLGLLCAGICGALFLVGFHPTQRAEQQMRQVMVEQQAAEQQMRQAMESAAEEAASPAFGESLARVRSDERVTERLKPPIRMSGNRSESRAAGDRNSVTLDYGVSGSAESATVHVVSEEIDGRWWYRELQVTFSDGSSVDLADKDAPIRLDSPR